jgi:tetratricopeptide (TPR) repeat protein
MMDMQHRAGQDAPVIEQRKHAQKMRAGPEAGTGDLKTAVRQALSLLSRGQTELAREQAEEILRQYPAEANSLFVVAAALRALGSTTQALDRLEALVRRAPDFALAQQELGFALSDAGDSLGAIEALQKAVAIEPRLPGSWKLLAELHSAAGNAEAAAEASNQLLLATSVEPELVRAVNLFREGKVAQSERLCRKFLFDNPANVTAIRLLADIGIKVGAWDDAENLLARCVELAPDFSLARLNYAQVLSQRESLIKALAQVELLLAAEPDRPTYLVLKGAILVKKGDFDRALACYEYLLSRHPPRPLATLVYGHALKTVGRQQEAIAAYRQAIALRPSFGDAYWSLANLKTFRFEDGDIEAMRQQIEAPTVSQEDHFHLCFALGKALEDRGEYEESFRHYRVGNTIKEELEKYDADRNTDDMRRMKTVCTAGFFSERSGQGCPAPDPIFIVGLPRSGSTLLEQILASHSLVDGTKELIDIPAMVRRLGGKRKANQDSRYPEVLESLDADQLRALGEEYLERTRVQRGSAPFFIDKMPNNFSHIGLIHLILPNATIIDARRHPMAACFSGYAQLFAKGQSFTYGLSNIGRYYRDYVEMMDHWDQVLPGKVLLVHYEDVVSETESQVRRVLDHCGLPFEETCLEFYRTERAVRTASSEQVRQPIYSGALDHWRHYEPWLGELKESLGPVLERYPID